jgi:hypothetical protein
MPTKTPKAVQAAPANDWVEVSPYRGEPQDTGEDPATPGDKLVRDVSAEMLLASKVHAPAAPKGALPEGVWTMEMMSEGEPVTADLFGDGRFLFTFRPILNDVAIQKRFRLQKKVDPETGDGYWELVKGYAEVLAMVLVSWPFMEEVTDEDDNPVYETEEQPVLDGQGVPMLDGLGKPIMKVVTTDRVKLKPLPLKQKNIERLPTDKAVLMFQAMQRALSGERT